MGIANSVDNTTKVFTAILALGLTGLLFLIIFGNLSGNLGFDRNTITITSQSGGHVNLTTFTISQATDVDFTGGFTVIEAWGNATINVSTTFLIPASNMTVSASAGTVVNGSVIPDILGYNDVNFTYRFSVKATSESNTDQVIGNLTGGAVQFFSFSNVWFILLAVTLLIIIVISVIGLVSKGGRSKFAS